MACIHCLILFVISNRLETFQEHWNLALSLLNLVCILNINLYIKY